MYILAELETSRPICCWGVACDAICGARNGPGIDDRPCAHGLPHAGENNAAWGVLGHIYDISITYTKTQQLARRLNNLADTATQFASKSEV